MEQISRMVFLAGVYFRGIKFSWINGKSAKFAKLRSSENYNCSWARKQVFVFTIAFFHAFVFNLFRGLWQGIGEKQFVEEIYAMCRDRSSSFPRFPVLTPHINVYKWRRLCVKEKMLKSPGFISPIPLMHIRNSACCWNVLFPGLDSPPL